VGIAREMRLNEDCILKKPQSVVYVSCSWKTHWALAQWVFLPHQYTLYAVMRCVDSFTG
jgi:hypothetical protein